MQAIANDGLPESDSPCEHSHGWSPGHYTSDVAICSGDTSWTDVLTAVGTVGAVVVALFGYFLPKLFPPKLRIAIADAKGVHQAVRLIEQGGAIPARARDAVARYYHVRVSNERRWTKAHNVQVMLLRIEQETTAGWVETWAGGGIPLIWQHQDMLGSVRNVGPPGYADLFNVLHNVGAQALQLTPKFGPLGVQLKFEQCVLRLTLQAQSDEADSRHLVLIARWDGKWQDGATEMAQHLRLELAANMY